MDKLDVEMLHENSMAFVGLLLDTVLTIKERYKLDEQTAIEICKLSATLYESYKDVERLDRQSENAKIIKDGLEGVGSAIWRISDTI